MQHSTLGIVGVRSLLECAARLHTMLFPCVCIPHGERGRGETKPRAASLALLGHVGLAWKWGSGASLALFLSLSGCRRSARRGRCALSGRNFPAGSVAGVEPLLGSTGSSGRLQSAAQTLQEVQEEGRAHGLVAAHADARCREQGSSSWRHIILHQCKRTAGSPQVLPRVAPGLPPLGRAAARGDPLTWNVHRRSVHCRPWLMACSTPS